MMAFCHAVACTVARMGTAISRRLDTVALVCGMLGVVSFIVEWVLYAWLF